MECILDPASAFASACEPEPVYLCYASVQNEVCLDACYQQLLARGKRLYFPKTDGKTMDFFEIRDLRKDFVIGSFGIREPAAGEKYDGSRRAAAFVPGVAFDEQGNRIGYGGGYYDRYFGRYPDIVKLGICYEKQLTEKITPAPWDVPMDALVTENRVICERSRLWN